MIGKKKLHPLVATQDFDALVLCVNLLCSALEVMNETSLLQSQKIASLEEEIRVVRTYIGAQ